MNEDTLWEHIHDLEGNINNLERENKQLKERLDQAIILLAEWCIAVEDNGTSWDDWDTWFKDANYRPGMLRELIDARKEAIRSKQ